MPRYDAYLVRVWRGDRHDGTRWACRLEHLPDGRHRQFGTLEELLARMRELLAPDDLDSTTAEPAAEGDSIAPE